MGRTVKQPDVRKQELLDIGIQLYFEESAKGISIQRVVQKANVATGLFYYYFQSKEAFLDEALNYYIDKEISSFETILESSTYTACEKLDAVFEAYSSYAEKMAPYRSNKAYHTQNHYALTEKLSERLKHQISNLLRQGLHENVFDTGNISITAGFIVNGLSIVFDQDTDISKDSLNDLKKIVDKILRVGQLPR